VKCSVIGLGNMGSGIAQTLARSGFELLVYNHTPSKAEALARHGIRMAKTVAEACQADAIITIVSDNNAVQKLLPQMLQSMKPGSVHIACSTISPSLAARLEKEHEMHGSGYVSTPVFGRPIWRQWEIWLWK
jgi:3-hydroxyisobutyrate dehydrogenase-like beta-hydroxyacid dehydrogenase